MERKRMLGVLIALCVVLAGVTFTLVWFAIVVPSNQQLEKNRLDIGQGSVRIQALEKDLDETRSLLAQTQAEWDNTKKEAERNQAQIELEKARQQLEQHRLEIGKESERIQAWEKELDAYRLLLTQTYPQWNNRENETQLIKAQMELEEARQQLVAKQAELKQLQQQLEGKEAEWEKARQRMEEKETTLQSLRERVEMLESQLLKVGFPEKS
jgi:chromosome segregation ATPase